MNRSVFLGIVVVAGFGVQVAGCPSTGQSEEGGGFGCVGDTIAVGVGRECPEIWLENASNANIHPVADEMFFHRTDPIWVRLTSPAVFAQIDLFQLEDENDDFGVAVPGVSSMNLDRRQITFTADTALETLTWYELFVFFENECQGNELSWRFRTSDFGTPIPDPTQLAGRTYALDFTKWVVLEPPGVGSMIGDQLTLEMFVHVDEVDMVSQPQQISLSAGTGIDGEPVQSFCNVTKSFTPSDFSQQPDFAVFEQSFTLASQEFELVLDAFELAGTFSADMSQLAGVSLRGTVDTRPLDTVIDPNASEGEVCNLLAGLGGACTFCPGDGQLFCFDLHAISITGSEQVGFNQGLGWLPINQDQTENHLCVDNVCANATDDDGDGVIDDAEIECDPAAWP